MRIDLHIHSKNCSDGRMPLDEIFQTASEAGIELISITDHDSLECQESAKGLAEQYDIQYVYGLELNVSFSHPGYRNSKPVALDFLAYQYDIHAPPLVQKLHELREYRNRRGKLIIDNINRELRKKELEELTRQDLQAIRESVDGSFGRPHIARYLVKKGIVGTRQEAFDQYLVQCDVPKMPLPLDEASRLVREAGGKLMLAHPNDPNGTSLVRLTSSLEEQQSIIRDSMLPYIDGIECWHSRHDPVTTEGYLEFARKEELMVTGGSDCHQQPLLMGTVNVPAYVAEQFGCTMR